MGLLYCDGHQHGSLLAYVQIKDTKTSRHSILPKCIKYMSPFKGFSSFFSDKNQKFATFSLEQHSKFREASICTTKVIEQRDPQVESTETKEVKMRRSKRADGSP